MAILIGNLTPSDFSNSPVVENLTTIFKIKLNQPNSAYEVVSSVPESPESGVAYHKMKWVEFDFNTIENRKSDDAVIKFGIITHTGERVPFQLAFGNKDNYTWRMLSTNSATGMYEVQNESFYFLNNENLSAETEETAIYFPDPDPEESKLSIQAIRLPHNAFGKDAPTEEKGTNLDFIVYYIYDYMN